MAVIVTPRTELDAVNAVIGVVGESPVNTLEGEANVDVLNARALIAVASAEVQDKGWTFNVDETFELVPDTFTQKIVYLPTYLRVTTPGGSLYVNREGFLWDRLGKTNLFTGRLTVTMVQQIPFEELPMCFRQLVTYLAAKRFNAQFYGDSEVDRNCDINITQARTACDEFELDYGGYNMFTNDPFFTANSGR
ncbi:tail protein [Ralstonia phage RSB2]|uniref:Putative tail tubular protein A n=1 Tax=Ralstonia phage RSB2 TaxID=913183 RepID=E5RV20_9CAUD|nr:tail protein [Ralstonia phage RSB2]BAJ51828.1 putative tail tubular protein A [Ralstonia phage RSB2]